MLDICYLCIHGKIDACTLCSLSQTIGKFMNIARKVTIGVIAAKNVCLQSRFDIIHFIRAQLAPRQASLRQNLCYIMGMGEISLPFIDMQNTFIFTVEFYPSALCERLHIAARLNRHLSCRNCIFFVIPALASKRSKPAIFMPRRSQIHR